MRILILGGTTEASALADALFGDPAIDATLSLAGVTRAPLLPRIPARIGGFGGASGLAAYLRDHGVDAVIDATHPFARTISPNAVIACAAADVALLRIARPPWRPVAGDRWTEVADMAAAAASLGDIPRRVLLTVGRKELAPFACHPWHRYVIRSVDPPPDALLPPDRLVIPARGPFPLEDERALLARHRIERLVTKNSGGSAASAKLIAAREAGIPVLMVAHPDQGTAERVETWQDALAWLRVRAHGVT
jgi:precorrin-6A/cobalt-precorrin-6A reductase